MGNSNQEIRFEVSGNAGIVTLDRPHALNALTFDQIRKLHAALEEWRENSQVRHVVVCSACEKAFSAGGDILNLYKSGRSGDPNLLDFFRHEYSLNAFIKNYPKPYIALINGIVMGGGVGVSIHGSHRIGGMHIKFAMPEVGIGFFPDVGATYFFSRMRKNVGMYCALTGSRLNQADAHWTGVITHPVEAGSLDEFEELKSELSKSSDADRTLEKFRIDPGKSELSERSGMIESIFGKDSVRKIKDELGMSAAGGTEWASKSLSAMERHSPLSLEIAFEQVRRGAGLSFEDCMKLEFRIVSNVMKGRDFYEGVRALLIDKDNDPSWQEYEEDAMKLEVERHFQESPDGDLDFA